MIVFFSGQNLIISQENLLRKEKIFNINFEKNLIIQDTLSILPSSVKIKLDSILLSPSDIVLANDRITIKKDILSLYKPSSIQYSYRVLAINFEQNYFKLDSSRLKFKDRAVYIGYDFSPYENPDDKSLITSKGLDYNGSFSRGFSVGNSQSLLLNSNFNLQMSGDLGNDITVKAAISDDNIPIQPEGNTQILQEFDKVYIEVQRKNTNIIAGDYELRENDQYFLNYHKRLKGISASHALDITENSRIKAKVSFAQSQGKFSRFMVPIIEGNQGPYKLQGNNNELFLIIRAGTERVYYDGRLLKRGIDEDYVISYDRAEITFTPKILITNNSRIFAEYEYLDQNYQRTLYALETAYETEKSKSKIQYYSEFDSKTVRQDIQLDSSDILNLELAGDQVGGVFVSGANLLTEDYNPDRNYYERSFTIDGTEIFNYSDDPEAELYIVNFSNVGSSQGSYSIDNSNAANGRTYKYVGEGLGDYAPLRLLVPPIQRSMTVLSSEYNFNKNRNISGELSMSQLDLNRFSEINNDDNSGVGLMLAYNDKLSLGREAFYTIDYSLDYEYINQHFQAINPYRSTEFNRDWNISDTISGYQSIAKTGIDIGIGKRFLLSHDFVLFDIENGFRGIKNIAGASYKDSLTVANLSTDYLNTSSPKEVTNFIRPKLFIERTLPFLWDTKTGVDYFGEYNERKDIAGDTLTNLSFSFDELKLYLKKEVSNNLGFEIGTKYREDRAPESKDFTLSTIAREYFLNSTTKIGNHSGLKLNFTLRDLEVLESELSTESSNSVLLGRLDYNINLGKGGFIGNTNYQVGSGQEARQEFEYVEVERGQGNYVWIDNNPADNVRQENEFRVDTESDTANFVLIPIFNNEFILTNTSTFNQSIKLNFAKLLSHKSESKWVNNIRKIFLSTNLRLRQKTQKTAGNSSVEFFNFNIQDTSIVSYEGAFNNTLFINRGSPKWDLQIGNRLLSNKFTLITGQESRQLTEYFTRWRLNLANSFDFILNYTQGDLLNNSQQFEDRNYDISSYVFSPEVNIRPTQNSRFIVRYSYKDKQQKINNLESLFANEFTLESTFRRAGNTSIDLSTSLVDVRYNGMTNSNIAFELLEGLKDGKNYLWSLAFTKRLVNNVDFIVSYEGRKTGISRTIHTARAQVKATF